MSNEDHRDTILGGWLVHEHTNGQLSLPGHWGIFCNHRVNLTEAMYVAGIKDVSFGAG